MVRRLPVIQSKAAEDEAAEARPRWQWVLIGAGLVFTSWIPLAMIALWIARVLATALAVVLLVGLSFALAAVGGGALVGRFGGRAGTREAALAGLVAALVAWGIALASGALAPWTVALASGGLLGALGALFAWIGGRLGHRRRLR